MTPEAQTETQTEPVLAKRARLNPRTGHFEIDGATFPYWIGQTVDVEAGVGQATELVLRVPLQHGALIDDEWEPGQ